MIRAKKQDLTVDQVSTVPVLEYSYIQSLVFSQ